MLGLSDNVGADGDVFRIQRAGRRLVYETALPWTPTHKCFLSNMNASLRRLDPLLRKLRRTDMLLKYDAVIRDQIDQGIVEKASSIVTGKEFYLPHCAVVRDDAETTKTQIVYDAFAHERRHTPSLNNCLQTGTPLQNQLWSVIVRNQFHPIVVAGDIEKAFLQV